MLVIQVVMLHRRNSWRILLGLISIVIMVDIHRNNNLKKLSLKKEYIQINSIQTSIVHQIIFIKAIVNPHKPQSLTVHNLLQYPICLISTLPHLRIYIQIAIQVTLNKLKQITRKKENPLLSKIILWIKMIMLLKPKLTKSQIQLHSCPFLRLILLSGIKLKQTPMPL